MPENRCDQKNSKHICAGLLAHVDAGKTTLSEALLYTSGMIRTLGRVDRQDAFLDTYALERERGITIFSKQALLQCGDLELTLLDTPGHVDFSAEMERTLQVLDYAVLVVSGTDGVQSHTRTLWQLLKRYQIPVFLFINKMDQPDTDRESLLAECRELLSDTCVDFGTGNETEMYENAALCEDGLLETFLEEGTLPQGEIVRLISERKIFPCFFGSALRLEGVEELLLGMQDFMSCPNYGTEFGAKVFKIQRDPQGNRLTYLKITGGSLRVRDQLCGQSPARGGASSSVGGFFPSARKTSSSAERISSSVGIEGETAVEQSASSFEHDGTARGGLAEEWREKVSQIRIYSGEKYTTAGEAPAGTVCAVTGLTRTYPGQGLGCESDAEMPVLEPVLTYQVLLPPDIQPAAFLPSLRELEEEEPQLHIVWDEKLQEIQAQVMGEVQIEILQDMIKERFGIKAEFGEGNIVYKETIASVVEGVGHFEPLRHYAEVHLLLEPGEPGSGMQYLTDCSEDILSRNWQRLILTHLEEREHRGVLTGSSLTDVKITVASGKAHLKHTEGGDFRQATYRAVRQGLMQAESILLEPQYQFHLELPMENTGRAMTDLERMGAQMSVPDSKGGVSILQGRAPVAALRSYPRELAAYTKGNGRLSCSFAGYAPCHNMQDIIEARGYDPDADLSNPSGSVFCTHGAGFFVEWDQVPEYMHVESVLAQRQTEENARDGWQTAACRPDKKKETELWMGVEEIDAILDRTYHANRKEGFTPHKGISGRRRSHRVPAETREYGADRGNSRSGKASLEKQEKYLLVDGYNIVFAWEELSSLAKQNIDGARGRLLDILCEYQGMKKCHLIVVFDAYRVKGHPTEFFDYHNIHVVFTREAETADQFIEKFAHENGRKYDVTVATSDGLEQIIIRGQGCKLLSARDLQNDVEYMRQRVREEHLESQRTEPDTLYDMLSEESKRQLPD